MCHLGKWVMWVLWRNIGHDPSSNFFRVIVHYSASRADFLPDRFMTRRLGWTCITVNPHVCFTAVHMEACTLHDNLLQDYKTVPTFSVCHLAVCLMVFCYTVLKCFCPVAVQSGQCLRRNACSFPSAKKELWYAHSSSLVSGLQSWVLPSVFWKLTIWDIYKIFQSNFGFSGYYLVIKH